MINIFKDKQYRVMKVVGEPIKSDVPDNIRRLTPTFFRDVIKTMCNSIYDNNLKVIAVTLKFRGGLIYIDSVLTIIKRQL